MVQLQLTVLLGIVKSWLLLHLFVRVNFLENFCPLDSTFDILTVAPLEHRDTVMEHRKAGSALYLRLPPQLPVCCQPAGIPKRDARR